MLLEHPGTKNAESFQPIFHELRSRPDRDPAMAGIPPFPGGIPPRPGCGGIPGGIPPFPGGIPPRPGYQ